MDVREVFGLDPIAEEKGQRVKLPSGGVVYVARANSAIHREALGRAFIEMSSEPEWATATDEERNREAEMRAAEVLVLRWEGFKLDGEDMLFCPENVRVMLREFDLFFTLVTSKANNLDAYRAKKVSEVVSEAGNGSDGIKPQKPETSKRSERLRGGRGSNSPPESSTSPH